MRNVRTTFQPDKEIQVDDAEYADLKQQGLLVEETKSSKKSTADNDKDAGGAGAENK